MPLRDPRRHLIVQFDGSIDGGQRAAGLGVVIRDSRGAIQQVLQRRMPPQTNNEAEYSAMIWALELLADAPPDELQLVSDSEVVVEQMCGRYSVGSPRLKVLHRRACELARQFPQITFVRIPRGENVLADALAREALWIRPPWRRRNATQAQRPVVARREGR
jgi:ribonuclease HI